jgi:hypothetical protein
MPSHFRNFGIALLLILIFGISVLLRLPHFPNKPTDSTGWLSSHTMLTLEIFQRDGLREHYFAPVISWGVPGDKFVHTFESIFSPNGDGYYLSYPPLGFLVPHFLSALTGSAPSMTLLTALNLACQFLTAFFIFLISYIALRKQCNEQTTLLSSFFAFSAYIFSAAPFKFHFDSYFVDFLAQPIFAFLLYICAKFIYSAENIQKRYFYALGVGTFLLVYTEWIGVFFAASIFLLSFSFEQLKVKFLRYILFAATFLALLTVLIQYSRIAGFSTLMNFFYTKFSGRSGWNEHTAEGGQSIFAIKSWLILAKWYVAGFDILLIFLALFCLIYLFKKKCIRSSQSCLLLCAALPVVFHHIMLFNHAIIHNFSVVKASPFLCLLSSFLIANFAEKFQNFRHRIDFFATIFVCFAMGSYYSNKEWLLQRWTYLYASLGEKIALNAHPTDRICIQGPKMIPPQIAYYSHRNVSICDDNLNARCNLRQNFYQNPYDVQFYNCER